MCQNSMRASCLIYVQVPFAPSSPFAPSLPVQPKIIAPASTMRLVWKFDTNVLAPDSPYAVPRGKHWADLTEEGTILVIEQPHDQTCAAVGGIMANRMMVRGLKGCVVSGRVRDIAELKQSGLPVSLVLEAQGCSFPGSFPSRIMQGHFTWFRVTNIAASSGLGSWSINRWFWW